MGHRPGRLDAAQAVARLPEGSGVPALEALAGSVQLTGDLGPGFVQPWSMEADLVRLIAIASPRIDPFVAVEHRSWNVAYFEPMLDPDRPLTGPALDQLGLGLLFQPAIPARPVAPAAIDVAVTAISDGRLDSRLFAISLTQALRERPGLARRLARSLSAIAQESPLHAEVVARALERSAEHIRGHELLVLWYELLVGLGHGVVDEAARAWLREIVGSSRTARAARDLLSLPAGAPNLNEPVATLLLAGRIQRVRLWSGS
jgi:hypothetical protein